MSVMMVQTKCNLNNTELFLKLFHIQCKEIGNNRTWKMAKWAGFRLNNKHHEWEEPWVLCLLTKNTPQWPGLERGQLVLKCSAPTTLLLLRLPCLPQTRVWRIALLFQSAAILGLDSWMLQQWWNIQDHGIQCLDRSNARYRSQGRAGNKGLYSRVARDVIIF